MKNIIVGICLLFFSFTTYSQYIEGRVLDAETLKPIENVHVYMDHLKDGDLTNNKGHFYLNFRNAKIDTGTIHLSHIAYKKLSIPYTNKKKEYTFYLSKNITDLAEIELIKKRDLKPYLNYKTLKPMRNAVSSFGSLLIDGKIYVVGGDASFEINQLKKMMEYDPERAYVQMMRGQIQNFGRLGYNGDLQTYDIKNNVWTKAKSKFRRRAYHNLNFYNNKIVVLGGKNISSNGKFEYLDAKIEVLNINKDTIEIDDVNPHQALNFASFTYQDKILVMGGSIKKKNNGIIEFTNKVHLFDLKTGYWYELDSMKQGKETSGVLIKDKIYLIGGFNNKPLSEIETFDLISKKWIVEGYLFDEIENPAITFNKNIIYIFNDGKIYTYDILTKELNEYTIELHLFNSKIHFTDNKLYIVGGVKKGKFYTNPSASLYSIDISEFDNTRINKSKSLK